MKNITPLMKIRLLVIAAICAVGLVIAGQSRDANPGNQSRNAAPSTRVENEIQSILKLRSLDGVDRAFALDTWLPRRMV